MPVMVPPKGTRGAFFPRLVTRAGHLFVPGMFRRSPQKTSGGIQTLLLHTGGAKSGKKRHAIVDFLVLLAMVASLTSCAGAAATREPTPSLVSPTPAASGSAMPELAGRIVFDRLEGTFGYEAPSTGLFILDLTTGLEESLDLDHRGEGFSPTWSPDGSRILGNIFDPPDIPGRPAILDPADGTLQVIDPEGLVGALGCGSWSPDGTTLACTLDDDEHPEAEGIYTVRVDGNALTQVTASPNPSISDDLGSCGGNDIAAAFSPDGARIAFIRAHCGPTSRTQAASVWLVNVDGTDEVEVVPEGLVNSHDYSRLGWSPDGRHIVFATETGDLDTVGMDGGDATPVHRSGPHAPAFAYSPAFSPDGTLILFSANLNGTELYVVDAEGGEALPVTDAEDAEVHASWTP